ncbi:hypothetical protein BCR42DRAFT_413625 [Absidia repens]|uniref:SET domain-containing protein n=1 Tax=Absidia repens TaxID=90262 RepID=A0A1X2IHY7_9FUNG|nr:hypothetical protein BCR42DRAFT_413625 [Absidia repens]
MKSSTVGLATTGLVVIAGITYVIYYDYQRRKNPTYRREKKKEKKREVKQAAKTIKHDTLSTIQAVLDQVAQDNYPTLTEEKEAYFMNQVSQGESLVAKGEIHYHDSVLPFYRALKVYPKPLDLIMMYQKTIPDDIFQMIISIMSLEQKKIQNGFYEHFPPKSTYVRLAELPSLESKDDDNKESLRRGLVADKNIKSGEIIYSEYPLISAMHPSLEGYYCHFCMRRIEAGDINKTACSNCDDVVFCGTECEKQGLKQYHQFMCTNNKFNAAENGQEFQDYCGTHHLKYPQMVSRFLSSMVAEEMDSKNPDQEQQHYSSWDHMDRMRYFESLPTENTAQEIGLIKRVLNNKVPGIDKFLTDDIYLMLKGKLAYNCYPVPGSHSASEGLCDKTAADEQYRQLPSTENKVTIGTALYRISTYIGQSMDDPNIKIVFMGNNKLSVVATRDIQMGEEITTNYILPN